MSNFTFSSTAQCDMCGTYLSDSDEDCDHNGETVYTHIFRLVGCGHATMTGVKSTTRYKWYALEEKLGGGWKRYEWLGPRKSVETLLNGPTWDDISELPARSMSIHAPNEMWDDE